MAKNSAININSISSVIVTDEDGVLVPTSSMTDGQVLIGSTGASPVAASLTAGSGISITPGAGALTIAATGGSSGGGLINIQYLTTSGTYTATAGTVSCLVMAVAGGGGGGGLQPRSTAQASSQNATASGGSGGAFGQKYYAIAPTGTDYVIGAGGAGGDAGSSYVGGDGGATTFNNGDMNLLGGGAGIYSSYGNTQFFSFPVSFSITSQLPPGFPDVSDNSDFTSNGSQGGAGNSGLTRDLGSDYLASGFGGDSMLGKGAPAPVAASINSTNPGVSATGYGGGGSGANGYGGSSVVLSGEDGGSGAPGIIIVWEYS